MISLYENGVYLVNGQIICNNEFEVFKITGKETNKDAAKKGTISYQIIENHNLSDNMENLQLRFDSLTSHDITSVGILQTAKECGITEFPVPFVITNCHNSLGAVGGTVNEDDHRFALSAVKKYGGIYVPPFAANIHSYNREMMAGCGKMILGSDSHTRYGALGTLGVGEGGGEIVKQLLGSTYDLSRPEVVAVYLEGTPKPGVGPHDIALSIIGAVYKSSYVKNRIMEFVGPGIANLSTDFRNAIDVMTTETTCWSSIWTVDDVVKEYYMIHGRSQDFISLKPHVISFYEGCVHVDLSKIECSIALPIHPSNTYTIKDFLSNSQDIIYETEKTIVQQIPNFKINLMSKLRDRQFYVDQGVIAGCSGGVFESICAAADILRGRTCGNSIFSLSIYPGSMPTLAEIIRQGYACDILASGAILRECFCGPCFGAGDCPANGTISIRHTTRNYPHREGSIPSEGQFSVVALMDSRSIAATAVNGGRLTAATELDIAYGKPSYEFDKSIYDKRVYNGFRKSDVSVPLEYGPNIKDWPSFPSMSKDLLLKICSYITDPVTTTDEIIPSGEVSSYRSNPKRLSDFTLSRRDPGYVGRSKEIRQIENSRLRFGKIADDIAQLYTILMSAGISVDPKQTNIGSAIYATMPGDGSAREQAASCQRVLGGAANIAKKFATKRYRSNCINWGIIPFITETPDVFSLGDFIFVPKIRESIIRGTNYITAFVIHKDGNIKKLDLTIGPLSEIERRILLDGCLINYFRRVQSDKGNANHERRQIKENDTDASRYLR